MKIASVTFSVVIPLYNKAGDVARAVRSAVIQSYAPLEILVVDDGSTDGGAEVVEALNLPGVRVIRQRNAGVSAARNRGAGDACGQYIALLDADDWWEDDFLRHVHDMISRNPGCGIYSTGFRVHRPNGTFPNEQTIQHAGVVQDYFRTAFTLTVCWTSACVIPRDIFLETGGFPVGMRRGEDLYMWTKVALKYPVCYQPAKLSNYNLLVTENSRSLYRPDESGRSFLDFYTPGNDDLNEYLARYQIGLAILDSVNGCTAQALKTEFDCRYTRRYRLGWWKLFVLNRLPVCCRKPALALYKKAAWLVSRKGVME